MLHRASHRPHSLVLPILAALAFLGAATARAATFDLIFADSIIVTTYPFNSGFTNGNNIALIVSTGGSNITQTDMESAVFEVNTSDPNVQVQASILNAGAPTTPVLPGEAVGTLLPGSPLLAKVLPGETVRNRYPVGVFWLAAGYPVGYTGTVYCTMTLTLGGSVVHYFCVIVFLSGSDFSFDVLHAERLSAQPLPTPARVSTWGAIKSLYR